MVDTMVNLQSHVAYLQERLRAMVPLGMMARLLSDGDVTPEWYVQRLVDMGMSLEEAIGYFTSVKNSGPGAPIPELPDTVAVEKIPPWQQRPHWPTRKGGRVAKLTARAHQVAAPSTIVEDLPDTNISLGF